MSGVATYITKCEYHIDSFHVSTGLLPLLAVDFARDSWSMIQVLYAPTSPVLCSASVIDCGQ